MRSLTGTLRKTGGDRLNRVAAPVPSGAKGRLAGQGGFTLIEVLISLAVIGLIVVAFTMALGTGLMADRQSHVQANLDSLAQSQMEAIKAPSNPYVNLNGQANPNSAYSLSVPSGYVATLTVEPLHFNVATTEPSFGTPYSLNGDGTYTGDDGVQQISISISYSGISVTLVDYKVNR